MLTTSTAPSKVCNNPFQRRQPSSNLCECPEARCHLSRFSARDVVSVLRRCFDTGHSNSLASRIDRNCKSLIRKLLIKDEHKRLGSASGASEVKLHKWFTPINWGLLRHQIPPVSTVIEPLRSMRSHLVRILQISPQASNGVDTVNFRTMRDSKSLDFDKHGTVGL